MPYPRLGGGYAAIDIAIRLGRAGGGARETPRAPGAAAVDSVGRRDTYLEALGQGVVAGEVGLEPHLGLDVRAGGVLGRLARAAAAAAAMEEGGGDVSVASSEGFVDAARPNRAIGARDREGRPIVEKIEARVTLPSIVLDLMTLGARGRRARVSMRALPGGDEEVREAADEGGGGQADRADEEQVHHVALAHVRDFAGHGRGDGVARHLLGRDGGLTAERAGVASELRGRDLHRGGGGESGHL